MEEKILFWSTLCYTFLLSGTMIGFGFLFQKRPPKNINGLYGYRTAMSMKTRLHGHLRITMREKFGFIVGLPAFLFRLWYCFYFAEPLALKLYRRF